MSWAQIVDSVSASATVRLDLDDLQPWMLLADGTDLSPPSLRRAVAGTLLADGARIPASAYDNRVITLRLRQESGTDDDAATALQALFREINRPTSILRWQPDTSEPVFFRCFRSDAAVPQWDPVSKEAQVRLVAEPFAVGVEETISTVAVSGDPALANGCFFDVNGVKGDVETPVVLRVDYFHITAGEVSAIAVRRRGTPSNMPFVLPAESLGQFTDTLSKPADPAYSGAGTNNWAQCTFSTSTSMVSRIGGSFPSSPTVDARGTYRVYLRCQSTGGASIAVRLLFENVFVTPAVAVPSTLGYVDLGQVQVPFGPDPVHHGLSGVELVPTSVSVNLYAQRLSGSGNLNLDHLLFMPADDRFALIGWPDGGTNVRAGVIDSAHEMMYTIETATDNIDGAGTHTMVGGYPMISPGSNRLFFIRHVGTVAPVYQFESVDIEGSYWPRYLYVRPATT